jgi:trans-feruloyl-CoA hydratase/vanillin synthase
LAKDLTSDDAPVRLKIEVGIAWASFNRPQKRNAMNPAINAHMHEILDFVEQDPASKVLVLTGEGEAFSAGMDLQEYFRDTEAQGPLAVRRAQRTNYGWHRRLRWFEKPTIAMVNGWCFGGAFSPLFACDLAIASEQAKFGISEINWGIIPGGNVAKIVADLMLPRAALYYIMTGEPFDGIRAAALGLVNEAVPPERLVERTTELARVLMKKNPTTLKAAKDAFKRVLEMSVDESEDYLVVRQQALNVLDSAAGREEGMRQFLDEKRIRPGLETYVLKDEG